MSERERERLGHDALGIVLFALSIFAAASIVMATRRPVEESGGTTAVISALVAAIGAAPALVLAAGLAWLGGRLWLGGVAVFAPRHWAGIAGLTVGLSVILGAVSHAGGGTLGASTGGSVARQLSTPVGVLFGLACLGLPLWFAWLRGPILARRTRARGWESAPVPPSPAESRASHAPEAPKREGAGSKEDYGASRGATGVPGASRSYETRLQPLDPPGVRRLGGIPEGARPLPPIHEPDSKQGAPAAPPVPERGSEAPFHAGQPAGADLAPRSAQPEPSVEPGLFPEGRGVERPGEGSGANGAAEDARASALAEERLPRAEASATPLDEPDGDLVSAPHVPPPAPSWEEPSLFEEEPVDAYGTPLALVERLRQANEATRLELAQVDAADEASPALEAGTGAGEGIEEVGETRAKSRPGLEIAAPASGEPAQPVEHGADVEPGDGPADIDEGEGREPARPPRPQRRRARAKPAVAEQLAEEATEHGEDVVLVPRAAPLASAEAADEDDLVFRAGCLILERKRVAVSMLQREFGLDFTQATALLDRLQAAGLIGPYLGGQHRDILLTPQEWRERVGAG